MSSDVPTIRELCLEHFGETNIDKCFDILDERSEQEKWHTELSERTCDASLFPYRAEGPFETPIPTPAEIAAARVTSQMCELRSTLNIQVWRVGPYMVKVGTPIIVLQEAENLIYLERNSSVRTPKVYAAFASREVDALDFRGNDPDIKEDDENLEYYYIVMEFIEGDLLSVVADELPKNWKLAAKIGQQLGEQLRRLRSVPPESPDHFGRVGGKPYGQLPQLYWPPAPDFGYYGPFKYEDLVERLIHTAKIDGVLGNIQSDFSPLERSLIRDARSALVDRAGPSDRVPVLSHLDTQSHNIIVKLVRDQNGKAIDVEHVVLIDWATLSWMPTWFETGELCREYLAPVDFYAVVGREALPVMGQGNIALAAFFGLCLKTLTFHTVFM